MMVAFSSTRSAYIRVSLAFSTSSSPNRFTSDTAARPYLLRHRHPTLGGFRDADDLCLTEFQRPHDHSSPRSVSLCNMNLTEKLTLQLPQAGDLGWHKALRYRQKAPDDSGDARCAGKPHRATFSTEGSSLREDKDAQASSAQMSPTVIVQRPSRRTGPVSGADQVGLGSLFVDKKIRRTFGPVGVF